MTTLDAGMTDVPLRRRRPTLTALAAAATAVAGFVVTSLVLKSLAHIALRALGLVEGSFGQTAEYVLVTGASMFAVRKTMNLMAIRYQGRLIVSIFMTISALILSFALASGIMKVDFVHSLLQMAALCLFAYLQFWGRDGDHDLETRG
jgi:hypothetical protein